MPGYTTCNCACTIPWAGPIHAILLVVIEDMNYKWRVISLLPSLKVKRNDHCHCLTFIIVCSHFFAFLFLCSFSFNFLTVLVFLLLLFSPFLSSLFCHSQFPPLLLSHIPFFSFFFFLLRLLSTCLNQ